MIDRDVLWWWWLWSLLLFDDGDIDDALMLS